MSAMGVDGVGVEVCGNDAYSPCAHLFTPNLEPIVGRRRPRYTLDISGAPIRSFWQRRNYAQRSEVLGLVAIAPILCGVLCSNNWCCHFWLRLGGR